MPSLTFERTGPPITEADLDSLEAQLGGVLPAEFRAFLLRNNGGKALEHAVRFTTPNRLNVPAAACGRFFEINDSSVYNLARNYRHEHIPDRLLQIGTSPAGNRFLLSLRPASHGTVYYQDHETPDTIEFTDNGPPPESMLKIADTFNEFLDQLYDPDAD